MTRQQKAARQDEDWKVDLDPKQIQETTESPIDENTSQQRERENLRKKKKQNKEEPPLVQKPTRKEEEAAPITPLHNRQTKQITTRNAKGKATKKLCRENHHDLTKANMKRIKRKREVTTRESLKKKKKSSQRLKIAMGRREGKNSHSSALQ